MNKKCWDYNNTSKGKIDNNLVLVSSKSNPEGSVLIEDLKEKNRLKLYKLIEDILWFI